MISALAGWLSLTTPSPAPTPIVIPPADITTPGILGFLVTFAVALAVIGIFLALTRSLRRVDRRGRLEEDTDL